MIQDHKELIVWQKSMDLVLSVYTATKVFPKDELYGLISQARRAAVSIPANIAEGRSRGSRKDFRNFLLIAFGSANELETHLLIANKLQYLEDSELNSLLSLLREVLRMLNAIIKKLKADS